ncbi:Phospholipase/carboxylesterase [Leptospira borgpetersenii str. 4E]|nr:Phospholipase/carboxylesterase [Leptospira borgpetersenii str. 4E]
MQSSYNRPLEMIGPIEAVHLPGNPEAYTVVLFTVTGQTHTIFLLSARIWIFRTEQIGCFQMEFWRFL